MAVTCPRCQGEHVLRAFTREDGSKSDTYAVTCGEASYLAGVGGKLLEDYCRAGVAMSDQPSPTIGPHSREMTTEDDALRCSWCDLEHWGPESKERYCVEAWRRKSARELAAGEAMARAAAALVQHLNDGWCGGPCLLAKALESGLATWRALTGGGEGET